CARCYYGGRFDYW
nr:immunoglobulin heavy chain junction region [Mus musculus]MBK4195712.1 immunoglobulin heavy chain junction region [Mus musculus]